MKWNILKNKIMKHWGILAILTALLVYAAPGCNDFPVDDDGLLITDRDELYVSSFDLFGTDFRPVTVGAPVVNDTLGTITATVFFGTDLKNLYPRFTLVTDAILEPKITGLTDFSGLSRQWTVISGDRKVRKTYTVTLTLQTP